MRKVWTVLVLILMLTACKGDAQTQDIQVFHDSEQGVTCYFFDSGSYGSGISCLRDDADSTE